MNKLPENVQRSVSVGRRIELNRLGIQKSESKCMRKVMIETQGDGGPWFQQYVIKTNLFGDL